MENKGSESLSRGCLPATSVATQGTHIYLPCVTEVVDTVSGQIQTMTGYACNSMLGVCMSCEVFVN